MGKHVHSYNGESTVDFDLNALADRSRQTGPCSRRSLL